MNPMEFYELVLFMTYFGQRCANVFNFTMTGTPAAVTGSFALAQAFGSIISGGVFPSSSIFHQLWSLLSTGVVFNQVRVKNPYNIMDFYSVPFAGGTAGQNSGEGVSPMTAYSLYSNQVRLDIQAGQKRFPGVVESAVGAGGVLGSGTIAALQIVADRMSAPLIYDDEGNTLTFNVVIAKKYTDLEADPPIRNAYWPTKAEQLANIASGVDWNPRSYVSTQVTRQYGRGR